MTETAAAPAAEVPAAQASPKKTKAPKKAAGAAKKPAVKPNHPPTGEMVNAAIVALKDKKGSSLQAIKKYIAAQYKVDVDKQATFIKKYLKSAVAKKTIVQTKGTGASGSFKLSVKAEAEKTKKVAAKKPAAKKAAASPKKPAAAKKPKAKAVAKLKEGAVKKPAAAKKPVAAAAAKKPAAAKKAPAKPKAAKPVKAKTAKAPTKPKAPKAKKAAPKAKAAPKK